MKFFTIGFREIEVLEKSDTERHYLSFDSCYSDWFMFWCPVWDSVSHHVLPQITFGVTLEFVNSLTHNYSKSLSSTVNIFASGLKIVSL